MNEIIPNDTKSLVPAKYYEIFALKILGLTYDKIAQRTGYSESHIKLLFSSKGVLNKLWQSWCENAKKDNVDEALTMMFGHLPDIVRANIIDAKSTDSMVGIAARKMLFEYTLGKPEERLKLEAKIGVYTFADWIKAETLKDKAKENEQTNQISKGSDEIHEGGLA